MGWKKSHLAASDKWMVCAAECDKDRPFQDRTRKTLRKVGVPRGEDYLLCEPCYLTKVRS